jgi:uncharacterized protein (DUF2461 family)
MGMDALDGVLASQRNVCATWLRERIHQDKRGTLRGIIEKLERSGFAYSGETLARVPSGYAVDHPNADLLRRKSMFMASPIIKPVETQQSTIIAQCCTYAEMLKPLNDWLNH